MTATHRDPKDQKPLSTQPKTLTQRITEQATGGLQTLSYILLKLKNNPLSYSYHPALPNLGQRFLETSASDGTGFHKTFEEAVALAKKMNLPVCEMTIGNKHALVICDYEIFETITKKNKTKLAGFDFSGIYETLFGPRNVLIFAFNDPRYKPLIDVLKKRFLEPRRLAVYAQQFDDILIGHLNQIKNNTIPNLEKFCSNLAIDFIAASQLGIKELTQADRDELQRIVKIITPQIIRSSEIALFNLPSIVKEGITLLPEQLQFATLPGLIKNGKAFIRSFLKKNAKYILNPHSDNILKDNFKEKLTEKFLLTDECVQFFSLILFASIESTAKLMEATIRLIADCQHAQFQDAVREEAAKVKDLKAEEKIREVPLANAAVKEAERLFPSFPHFKDRLTEDLTLKINDQITIQLRAGDIILYSPQKLHRQKAMFGEDAEAFNPGRYTTFDADRDAKSPAKAKPHLTFGFSPRICPGWRVVDIQAALLSSRMTERFQMRLIGEYYPYATSMMYSNHFDKPVSVEVLPVKTLVKTLASAGATATSPATLDVKKVPGLSRTP